MSDLRHSLQPSASSIFHNLVPHRGMSRAPPQEIDNFPDVGYNENPGNYSSYRDVHDVGISKVEGIRSLHRLNARL